MEGGASVPPTWPVCRTTRKILKPQYIPVHRWHRNVILYACLPVAAAWAELVQRGSGPVLGLVIGMGGPAGGLGGSVGGPGGLVGGLGGPV